MSAKLAGESLVAPALRQASDPFDPQAHRASRRLRAVLRSRWTALISLTAVILGYADGWTRGALLVDGPGIAVYVRLALDHLAANGRVSYWVPEMWLGMPLWSLGPSFPVLLLMPLAALFGSVTAVKIGILGLQVAGAMGAYVLARSLWDHVPAALVAGLVYGLDPIMISHGGLAGTETSVGVIAATPWLVWSLRKGFRGDGTRYLVVAGLVAAFAILHEAEFAYGLAMLCALLVLMELGRIRRGVADGSARQLLGRAGIVVAVSLGAVAHWLLPFLAMHKWFVLSPQVLVHGELVTGIGKTVGEELGIFLHRSTIGGVITPDREGLIGHVLYLGRVPAAIALLTAFFVARRDDDTTLSAVLLAAAFGLWLSTGAVTLADGGPAARGDVIALAVTGALAAVILGGFVLRLGLGRATGPIVVTMAGFFFLAPYLSPFLLLQRVVPLLASIRFPRFYILAVLALALGTAWPVAHVRRLFPPGRRRLGAVVAVAVALAVPLAFLVDVWPFRSFYRLQPPASAAAYRPALATLAGRPAGSRVTPDSLDPRIMTVLLGSGADVSLGWPHPVSGAQPWRLTVEPLLGPIGYRLLALGLSNTSYVSKEKHVQRGSARQAVSEVQVFANPVNLPMVRAYDRALVVGDRSVTPELAVALAHRNVGVVAGGTEAARALGDVALPTRIPTRSCELGTVALPPGLLGELGIACAMHPWLSNALSGQVLFGPDTSPGAEFTAFADGLRGVSVWFIDAVGETEMVLNEVGPDGSVGPEVARAKASANDEYGMTTFGFDPIAGSAGRRYVYHLECPGCFAELAPQMVTGRELHNAGNLLLGGRPDRKHSLAFAPVYDRMATTEPSAARVDGRRRGPGRWRVTTSGPSPTLLVVAEAYFPGWRARVDGRPAPVLEADGAFLGVPVGPGNHEVTLEYHTPAAAQVGRMITAGTLAAIVAGGLWSRRRRRHALEMGPPPVEPPGKEALGTGEGEPGHAVAGGQGPGTEGDEAVLADVDHAQPGGADHLEE